MLKDACEGACVKREEVPLRPKVEVDESTVVKDGLVAKVVVLLAAFDGPLAAVEVEDEDTLTLTTDALDEAAAAEEEEEENVASFLEDVKDDFAKEVAEEEVVEGGVPRKLLPPLKGFIYEGIMLKIFSCSRLTGSTEGCKDNVEHLAAELSVLVEEDVIVVRTEEAVDLRSS